MNSYQELIENIRESRKRMSRDCCHDSDKLIAYLESYNAKYSEQVASFRKIQDTKLPKHRISPSD